MPPREGECQGNQYNRSSSLDSQFRQPLQDRDQQVRGFKWNTGILPGAVDRCPQGPENRPPISSLESLDATRISIRPIGLHHPDEVRHHHPPRQESLRMTRCLSMFEICLLHGEITKNVSVVDVLIVLPACIVMLHHSGLRVIYCPQQQLR